MTVAVLVMCQGGKAAAETMLDMRLTGDYSRQSTQQYQLRWMKLFGHDFSMVSCDCALMFDISARCWAMPFGIYLVCQSMLT